MSGIQDGAARYALRHPSKPSPDEPLNEASASNITTWRASNPRRTMEERQAAHRQAAADAFMANLEREEAERQRQLSS